MTDTSKVFANAVQMQDYQAELSAALHGVWWYLAYCAALQDLEATSTICCNEHPNTACLLHTVVGLVVQTVASVAPFFAGFSYLVIC